MTGVARNGKTENGDREVTDREERAEREGNEGKTEGRKEKRN